MCITQVLGFQERRLIFIWFCSVKTDLMSIGANSTLLVAKVNSSDSGNYTCSIGESQQYTVLIHVLNGKLLMTEINFSFNDFSLKLKFCVNTCLTNQTFF